MDINKYKVFICFVLIAFSQNAFSQNEELQALIEVSLNHNKTIEAERLQVEAAKANIGAAFDFDKTAFYYERDANNIAPNGTPLSVFGVEQSFLFPTVYAAKRNVFRSQWEQKKAQYEIEKNRLSLEVSKLYWQIVYLQNKELYYINLDTLYSNFSRAGNRKYELGEANYLEKITAEAKARQVRTVLLQLKNRKIAVYEQLQALIQTEEPLIVRKNNLELLDFGMESLGKELQSDYNASVSKIYLHQQTVENQAWLPDWNIGFFTGTNKNLGYYMNGVKVGISLPLLFSGNVSRTKTAKLERQSWENARQNRETQMQHFLKQKQSELAAHKQMIDYYMDNGKNLSQEILKTAESSYKNGAIDFFQYIQSIENAFNIEIDYLDNLVQYNTTALELYYGHS